MIIFSLRKPTTKLKLDKDEESITDSDAHTKKQRAEQLF